MAHTTVRRAWLLLFVLVLCPARAFAQASIAGTVRDTSGAVLPGVTVEATSPALIEQSRAATTDGTGQYKILELRPGTYAVTFSLAGFNTVKQTGIELSGSFVASINIEMRVGALEETVNVTGASPIVDVQSTTKQRVLEHAVIDSVPSGRVVAALGALIPGVSLAGGGLSQDVGGSQGGAGTNMLAHGSKTGDMRITQNGVVTATLASNGAFSLAVPNVGAAQEVTVDTAAVSAELATGGPRINFIPRDGGNTVHGSVFVGFTNDSLQGSNFTQRVRDRGLVTPDSIKKLWDVNPGFGGPVERDRLWYYVTVRHNGSNNYAGGMFYNLNANNPNGWTYVPDTSRPAYSDNTFKDAQGRLTWQATPRNKFAVSWDTQTLCSCPRFVGTTFVTANTSFSSPEAGADLRANPERLLQLDWTSPLSNRLLLEGVVLHALQGYQIQPRFDGTRVLPGMISVTDQSNGLTYRARSTYSAITGANFWYRGAVSYVTGAHALKVGFNNARGYYHSYTYTLAPVSYRVNTVSGVTTPNQLTVWDTPFQANTNVDADFGAYVQDRWTIHRWTLTGGLRFDLFKSSFPEQIVGPTVLIPGQNLTFPKQANQNYRDVTPRLGAVYDLRGDGKTALKISLNKYLQGQAAATGLAAPPNPVNTLVTNTTRSWSDANRDFVPDCDLTNPIANGECGALANARFGQPGTVTFDQDLLTGWGHRFFNWEFSAGVQQQIMPRVSVEVGYFRRWYGNFQITDNTLVSPSNYSPYSITAPLDTRLPGGGGYPVQGLFDLSPDKVGQVQPLNTLSNKYGQQREHWNGFDFSVNARIREGMLFQGGVSTGHVMTDNCDVVTKVDNPSPLYCHQEEPFLTQVKLLGSYTVPKVDVQVSGAFQSLPGPAMAALYTVPNALIAPSLGRNLSGGAANATVNVLTPFTQYGDRLNQLDLRFGKILRFGRNKAVLGLDLYNATNSDAILFQNDNFARWEQAQRIQLARFVKFNVQYDF